MTNEQREAIDNLNFFYEGEYITKEMQNSANIISNMIEELLKKKIPEHERKILDYDEIIARLEEENTKKDKMIDLIAEKLAKTYHYTPKKCSLKDKENIDCNNYKNCTDCAKHYLERKVKNEKEKRNRNSKK